MMSLQFVDNDIVTVWKDLNDGRSKENTLAVLFRGNPIHVLAQTEAGTQIRLDDGKEGWIRSGLRLRLTGLLRFVFMDVGQGDACLMTTPSDRRVLIDGGENDLAARYLAKRYWSETAKGGDVRLDAMVVTHGDADHFNGLSSLVVDAASEPRDFKRIRVAVDRVFHNGLVKRSAKVKEVDRLGSAILCESELLVPLVDDPRSVTDPNTPFARWQGALDALCARGATSISRLDSGTPDAFNFLDEVSIEVLGPTAVELDGVPHLPLLSAADTESVSTARTINGHSIVLRARMKNVSVLLTGDLHSGIEQELVRKHDGGVLSLASTVLKVPHHGSDDISQDFVDRVAPVVSVISAGDEDVMNDYMHPRASVLAMLGRNRRGADPLIFVTNLAAFDRYVGRAFYAVEKDGSWAPDVSRGTFYARERTTYGVIHVITDGERLLVLRRSARGDRFEPYSFRIDSDGVASKLAVDRV